MISYNFEHNGGLHYAHAVPWRCFPCVVLRCIDFGVGRWPSLTPLSQPPATHTHAVVDGETRVLRALFSELDPMVFVNTDSIASNNVSTVFSISDKHVVPGARVMATICTDGTPTVQGVSVCIREIGWGMFRFYIANGTSAAITCNLTLIFNVSWPLSLTP